MNVIQMNIFNELLKFCLQILMNNSLINSSLNKMPYVQYGLMHSFTALRMSVSKSQYRMLIKYCLLPKGFVKRIEYSSKILKIYRTEKLRGWSGMVIVIIKVI